MSFLSRAFTGIKTETRAINPGNWGVPTPYEDGLMHGGLIPEGNPMNLAAFYACVRILSDIVATLDIKAYRMKDGATQIVDPQPRLFTDSPYPGLTWFDWLWMQMQSMAVTGNCYGYITARDPRDDRPTAIMPIHPDCINIEYPNNDGIEWPEPVYHIEGKRVSTYDIVHMKRFPIPGRAYGMSPVEMMASSVGLGLAAERYGLRYFRDSANPSGILSSEQDLTPEQARQAQKSWIKSHQGRRLPAVMSAGLKWQSITLTPNESQFLETRAHQRSEIAMFFGVPPHMIGNTEKSTSWGTGIEEQTLGFLKFTLTPWLECIEQALTMLLPRGMEAKFSTENLVRTDVKTRMEAYNIGRNAGLYSVNEIRDMEDMPPIGPEGDIRLQPSNYVPLGTEPSEYLGGGSADSNQPASGEEGN